jgi:hypothetical protein
MLHEQMRERSFITAALRWRDRDEDAAEAWLAQSPLSEEAREQARTFPPGWKRGPRQGDTLGNY